MRDVGIIRARVGIDPCKPSSFLSDCEGCRRHSPHLPDDPELRTKVVLINAAPMAADRACCPMRVQA